MHWQAHPCLKTHWYARIKIVTQQHVSLACPGKPLTASDSCGQWCIDNPYYTADTKVVIRRPDGSKFGSLTGYEAIILVFDAANQTTWDAVKTWAHDNAAAADVTEITLVRTKCVYSIVHTCVMVHACACTANHAGCCNQVRHSHRSSK